MLRIRLSRTGKKKQASYRVVVTNIEAKRDGRIVERLGYYNPLSDPSEYRIQEDRALYWLSVGAQPTDAVRRLLEKQGTMDRLTRLRQGEPMDSLIAEYTGVPVESAAVGEEADEAAIEEMATAVATAVIAEEE
jgi:small subunit ribosomal protein S16